MLRAACPYGKSQGLESFVELFEQRYDTILTPAAPGTAPKGLASTGDPLVLHAVDALRNAGGEPAARRSARRPARRRRASSAHGPLVGRPGRDQLSAGPINFA